MEDVPGMIATRMVVLAAALAATLGACATGDPGADPRGQGLARTPVCPPSTFAVGPRRQPPVLPTTEPGLPGSHERLTPGPEGCPERFPLAAR